MFCILKNKKYILNCFHSFSTKNKLQSHKSVCKNKDFCNIIMPSEDTKILEFKQHQNFDKAPFTMSMMYIEIKIT